MTCIEQKQDAFYKLSKMVKQDIVTKNINLEATPARGLPALNAEDCSGGVIVCKMYVLHTQHHLRMPINLEPFPVKNSDSALPLVELEGEGRDQSQRCL